MNELEEIQVEYVYLTIPTKYICTYHKILQYMANFGKRLIDDCSATCKGNSKNIISCWNMFQSAIASYNIGKVDEADFFINYINKQLAHIYKGTDNVINSNMIPVSITEDGHLKAVVGCSDGDYKFFVDSETGKLYQEYLNNKTNDSYEVTNNNLIYNYEE